MNAIISLRRITTVVIALCLIAVLVSLPYTPNTSFAQDGEQQITYGENLPGQIAAGSTAVFFFEAEANDVAEVQILAFGFAPVVQIQDTGKTQVLAANQNTENATTVELTYTTVNPGRHYIVVGGVDASQAGQFGISLAKGERELPPGTPIGPGQTLQGTVDNPDVPVVYDFATSPDSVVTVSVRSLTGGYSPIGTVQTENGEVIASLGNPRLSGFSLSFAPGGENLKLVIDKGVFDGSANFEVSLGGASSTGAGPVATEQSNDGGSSSSGGSDYGDGLASMPTSGCYLSVGQRTNIRSGGSTSHPIIAVLGVDGYLAITGYNSANGTWYQVAIPDGRTGWMASSVVATGGDCNNLAVANYDPAPGCDTGGGATPTYTATVEGATAPPPTATTSEQIAPPDSDYSTEVSIKGGSATVSGAISYPNGDTTDKIFYDVKDFDSVTTSGEVQLIMVCTGTGTENVRVNFNNVGSVGTVTCNGSATTTKFHTNDSDQGFVRIDLIGGSGAYVNWSLTLTGLE